MRWTVSLLVGLASMVGLLILVVLVSLALEPPTWLQVVLGVALVVGGGAMGWVVYLALGSTDSRESSGPRSVDREVSDA